MPQVKLPEIEEGEIGTSYTSRRAAPPAQHRDDHRKKDGGVFLPAQVEINRAAIAVGGGNRVGSDAADDSSPKGSLQVPTQAFHSHAQRFSRAQLTTRHIGRTGFWLSSWKESAACQSSCSGGLSTSKLKKQLVFRADSPGDPLLRFARSRTNRQFFHGAAYLRRVEENAATPFHVRD